MTYDQLLNLVRHSKPQDWLYNDDKGVHTFKADLNVRIERRQEKTAFSEPWAVRHPDPSASLWTYDIFFGGSPVYVFKIVSVDGHRADLPLPDPKTKVISRKDYELARAIDWLGTLDEYIVRSGLTVEQESHVAVA
jgi:hypothetical protein